MRWVLGLAAFVALAVAATVLLRADDAHPEERLVAISTTACGHASATRGTGVIIEDGRVLTTAHTVSGAGSVFVEAADQRLASTIEVFDAQDDLAILGVPGVHAPAIELAEADIGHSLSMVSAGPLGMVDVTVTRRAEVRIEAVRSTESASRLSIEFDRRVALGDSGAGLFDQDGRLAGVVYGRSRTQSERSFATRIEGIERVLESTPSLFECDPEEHRVVAISGQ